MEAQQDAAADRGLDKPIVIAGDAARRTERATLALARTRAQADLKDASVAAHRTMLEQAIAHLDRRIASLEIPNPKTKNPKPK